MTDFGEVLQGFVIPQLHDYLDDGTGRYEKRRVLGDTGLTARVLNISYLWEVCKKLRQPRLTTGRLWAYLPILTTLRRTVERCWMLEVLPLLDKAEFGKGKSVKLNSTVKLCHLRFQANPATTTAEKTEEQKRFDLLFATYASAKLKDIRDKAMFHLDHAVNLAGSFPTGNVEHLTEQLIDWLLSVAPVFYKHHLDVARAVEIAQSAGKGIGRDYRRMLLDYQQKSLRRKRMIEKP